MGGDTSSDANFERHLIISARNDEHIALAKQLFLEYAESLGFSLCFQGFDAELENLPGEYAAPAGELLLAYSRVTPAASATPTGCVGLRKIEANVCEMKRLFIRPEARGHGLGRALVERIIQEARLRGYDRMRLDTLSPQMDSAIRLYRSVGFREIAPYTKNPLLGALYFELKLGP